MTTFAGFAIDFKSVNTFDNPSSSVKHSLKSCGKKMASISGSQHISTCPLTRRRTAKPTISGPRRHALESVTLGNAHL